MGLVGDIMWRNVWTFSVVVVAGGVLFLAASFAWRIIRSVQGLDGEIGAAKEFHFDDQRWTIRPLAADTGRWLPGRC